MTKRGSRERVSALFSRVRSATFVGYTNSMTPYAESRHERQCKTRVVIDVADFRSLATYVTFMKADIAREVALSLWPTCPPTPVRCKFLAVQQGPKAGQLGIVGRCIYCGRDDEPLTREHIVPTGLRGQWVLRDASCQRCQQITSSVELNAQRAMLGAGRAFLGFARERKSRDKALQRVIWRDSEGKTLSDEVAGNEWPAMCFPLYPPPAAFTTAGQRRESLLGA